MSLCWKLSRVVDLNPTWSGSGLSCSADILCHSLGTRWWLRKASGNVKCKSAREQHEKY